MIRNLGKETADYSKGREILLKEGVLKYSKDLISG